MTHDEIIRIAREASGGTIWWPQSRDTLERFAALVAEREREAIIKLIWNTPTQIDDEYVSPKDILTNAIRAREGEK